MEHSDSREKLFDSSLTTVNVSVNTELPMDFSYGPKEEIFDYLHFYGEMDNDVFHKMISVDDLTYSTLFSDEVFDTGEWHTYAGLETSNVMKSTRHGNELLEKSIQSATERGDSGIDNIAYLSGDDTGGTGHTQVYESSNNMLVGNSISEDQSDSDMDLEDGFFSDDEIYSDIYDGEYILTDESLEGTLDFGSFKSCPCTVVSSQAVSELDPSADLLSSEVPDLSDKWKDDDFDFCVFDEMRLEFFDQDVMFSSPIGFVGSFIDIVDYVEDILKRYSSLEHLLFAKSPDCDDAASFCSILTDKLLFCQSDTPDSARYFSYDSFKAMYAKQRFFDAAFNNEPCIGSTCIYSCNAIKAIRHQLSDAANSNIQNEDVLNTTEATAVSNIPSKISGEMFFPTTFLQCVKDKYENNNSYRKDPATNICGTNTTSGRGNVGYIRVRGLVLRNDTVIPCSETIAVMIRFCGHVFHMIWRSYLNLYAGESVKSKPGDLMVVILETTTQKYYSPGMVNLVKESVECCIDGSRVNEVSFQNTIGNRNHG